LHCATLDRLRVFQELLRLVEQPES